MSSASVPARADGWLALARGEYSRQPRWTRVLLGVAAFELGYLAAQQLDTYVFTSLRYLASARPVWEVFKGLGYFPLWLYIALALAVCETLRARRYRWGWLPQSFRRYGRILTARRARAVSLKKMRRWLGRDPGKRIAARAVFLISCPFVAMAVAELLKLVVRRERPQAWLEVMPVFRDWSGAWWQNNDLGMPSSHAATAFGAAFALVKLYPKGTPVWMAVAVCCALSRVIDQAHTLTDVYAGAVVAWVLVSWITRRWWAK